MITTALQLTVAGHALALLLCAYRAVTGPTVEDRVVALDAANVMLMAILVAGSMLSESKAYLDYALVLAVLSLVATIAFGKYIERGVIIERSDQ